MRIFCFLSLFFLCLQASNNASLIMVGDALLHSRVYNDALSKDKKYDFYKIIAPLKEIISAYDLAFYNQESILGGKEMGLSSYPNFNSPQEFGNAMLSLGFNLVSLANNHILDKGEKGVLSSLSYWNKQNSLIYAGSYFSNEDKNALRFFNISNIKFGLLAYTYGVNGHSIPKNKPYLVSLIDKEKMKKEISALKSKVDVLLVSIHWGDEYVFMPNKEQRNLAKFLAKLGVDVIIGTHSHVVAPIEFIDDTLVIYSLGNFLSAQNELERRIGLLVGLEFQKDEKGSKISNLGFEFIYTHRDSKDRNFRVYPFRDLNNSILENFKDIQKQYEKIVLDFNKSIKNELPF